jgi:predicted DNA-binding ribbon-helix-helix protein
VFGQRGSAGLFAIDLGIHWLYTSGMKRTTVFLTEGQIKSLHKLAKRKTITVAQLIRLYVQAGIEGDSK